VGLWRDGGRLRRWDPADEATRRARRIRLAQGYEELRARFGELRMSDDTHARISDVALDIGESQNVPKDVVQAMAAAADELGFRTFVSTVHLHITLDQADKATGTLALLSQAFDEQAAAAKLRYAYVGDSANDAACFSAFETTFAVKNVESFLAQLPRVPRYVASKEQGAGFAQIADRLLELRRPADES
jgi:hydroxymethylpyrimidine pyrophosphatase-like HAD family hydrolase